MVVRAAKSAKLASISTPVLDRFLREGKPHAAPGCGRGGRGGAARPAAVAASAAGPSTKRKRQPLVQAPPVDDDDEDNDDDSSVEEAESEDSPPEEVAGESQDHEEKDELGADECDRCSICLAVHVEVYSEIPVWHSCAIGCST
jgi:hypothetical protein